ncbi:hypothetical protein [Vibrio anguillarum]|uniref:YopX protein domain-containing protein n=1 Tax=Vibrio anguillarum TaxID=55601 RepID=A0AAW4BJG2_VIBAN|nr:hypothetical protein [Vibrio anguillarum]MBF4374509.1 hypothetical protein [Vibrio anguillarum]MBF4438115.1 hypothetical protein [Vibrio anguillarum]
MKKLVACLKHDSWIDTDVFELDSGDVFLLNGKSYVAKEKAYIEDGKPNIPARLYGSDEIVINLSKEREFIMMAMDYVYSSASEFGDGTMMICGLSDGNSNIYSPRLPVVELNAFCQKHIEQYRSFFNENEKALESGRFVAITKFW